MCHGCRPNLGFIQVGVLSRDLSFVHRQDKMKSGLLLRKVIINIHYVQVKEDTGGPVPYLMSSGCMSLNLKDQTSVLLVPRLRLRSSSLFLPSLVSSP